MTPKWYEDWFSFELTLNDFNLRPKNVVEIKPHFDFGTANGDLVSWDTDGNES